MSALHEVARDWLPPIVRRRLSSLARRGLRFDGGYASWDAAVAAAGGYQDDAILERTLDAALKVKGGQAVFERDSVLFHEPAYEWPVLAGLLRSAARNGGKLAVLDFGGGLGSSYFQHRRFLAGLAGVRWCVVEQAHFCAAGRSRIEDDVLRFFDSIEACRATGPIHVVLLSGVLQYLRDPHALLASLSSLGADTIIIDRTIVNGSDSDRACVQHVPPSIYAASYACWSLSEARLLASLRGGFGLEASFDSLEFPALARIDSSFRGYIFGALAGPCAR